MDISFLVLLLVATAATAAPSGTPHAYEFNNTHVFTQIVPTSDLSQRDAIYITPELLFVGKPDGKILRCLVKDPSVCETFHSYVNTVGVTSTVASGEYLFASMSNGVMLRCHLYEKNSCTTFNNYNYAMNSLAVSGGYIFAGLGNGRMVKCDLYKPSACTTFNQFQTQIMSMAATEKYIYAGLSSKEIWRCAVASENSCRLVDNAATTPYSQIRGMTASEETVVGVTEGGTIWKCTRGYNCTTISVPDSGYKSLTTFDSSIYTLQGSTIWICTRDSFNCSIYDKRNDSLSISFAYSTFKMQDRFVNEEKTCLSDEKCPPFKVYYEINQRPMLEVFVRDGKLYNSRGRLVDTRKADVGQSGPAAIFAMGVDGQILVSNVHNAVLETSSLFAGKPVAGAGEMVVENGIIKSLRACSDQYQPTVELNQQVISVLRLKGYTETIDNLPCCKGNYCGQYQVEINTIGNVQ